MEISSSARPSRAPRAVDGWASPEERLRVENRHGFRRDRSADASVGARRGVEDRRARVRPGDGARAAAFVERTFERVRTSQGRRRRERMGGARGDERAAPSLGRHDTRRGRRARGGDSDSDVSWRRWSVDFWARTPRTRRIVAERGGAGRGASRVAWARLTRRRRSEREGQTRRRARTENVSSSSPRRTSSREEASRNGESGRFVGAIFG